MESGHAGRDTTRAWSLRRRLLGLLLALTLALWGVSAALFFLESQAEGRDLFDRSLQEAAALLLRLAEHEIDEHGTPMAVELLQAETHVVPQELRFQVWTPELLHQVDAGTLAERPFMPLTTQGFGWMTLDGERWRTYAAWNSRHSVAVQIAEPSSRRRELSRWTYLHLFLLGLLIVPMSAIGIGWILNRSFAPLRRTANAVAKRTPDDLEPVGLQGAPEEVAPLLVALERLLVKVREVLERERRFTADAAHELRSPLAAIRANAQIIRSARSPQESAEIIGNLLASVDRGSRLIDQLLLLARIDSGAYPGGPAGRFDLGEVLRLECDAQQPHAALRGIGISVSAESVVMEGERGLLAILVRNLLDNAIRYSPAGSSVVAHCHENAERVELIVSDNGPGIPEAERQRIFERFYRVVGNDSSGSGLGLSIVRAITELHHGTVEVRPGPDGMGSSFVVVLPRIWRSG